MKQGRQRHTGRETWELSFLEQHFVAFSCSDACLLYIAGGGGARADPAGITQYVQIFSSRVRHDASRHLKKGPSLL